MTLHDVLQSLPNGLHDAELMSLRLSFVTSQAHLHLDVWIGDDSDVEAYRQAELILSGVAFWITETPDPARFSPLSRALSIDMGLVEELDPAKRPTLPLAPDSASPSWVYVNQWNAFMYFAAQEAALHWLGDRYVRNYP